MHIRSALETYNIWKILANCTQLKFCFCQLNTCLFENRISEDAAYSRIDFILSQNIHINL